MWLTVNHKTSVTSGEWIRCSKPIPRASELGSCQSNFRSFMKLWTVEKNLRFIKGLHWKCKYRRLLLTQLCITQYYHLSRPEGPVPVFSPIYYCNSTTFISTMAKSIKLITRYEKLVPLINFSVFYITPNSIPFHKKIPFYLNVSPINPPLSTLITPLKPPIVWSLGPRVWHVQL